MPDIAIVGGGISGLSCAYMLQRALPEAQITLLESTARAGGLIDTFRRGGLVMEAGPHGFLNAHPSTLQLALDLGLGEDLLVADESARRRYVLLDGKLQLFPSRPSDLWSSPLLTLSARLRLLWEPLSRKRLFKEDLSIGEFLRARLGHEVVQRLIDPLIAGTNGGDIDLLSLRATLPKVATLAESGASLLKAAMQHLARQPPTATRPDGEEIGRRLVSFRRGLGQMIEALVEALGTTVRYGFPVTDVKAEGNRWRVIGQGGAASVAADVVVSAAAAPQASSYLAGVGQQLSSLLGGIRYAPMVVATLAYPRTGVRHSLDGFGYLVPACEGSRILGVLWASSMFPQRNREDSVLLHVICGGARAPEICDASDASILAEIREQLCVTIGASSAPTTARVARHQGLPQYELGHLERIARLREVLARHPGLFVTGNFLDGIGINACTQNAERIVTNVTAYLARQRVDRSANRSVLT